MIRVVLITVNVTKASNVVGSSFGRIGGHIDIINVEDGDSEDMGVETFDASVLECKDGVGIIVGGSVDGETGEQSPFHRILMQSSFEF